MFARVVVALCLAASQSLALTDTAASFLQIGATVTSGNAEKGAGHVQANPEEAHKKLAVEKAQRRIAQSREQAQATKAADTARADVVEAKLAAKKDAIKKQAAHEKKDAEEVVESSGTGGPVAALKMVADKVQDSVETIKRSVHESFEKITR